jgi:hypothetical protein
MIKTWWVASFPLMTRLLAQGAPHCIWGGGQRGGRNALVSLCHTPLGEYQPMGLCYAATLQSTKHVELQSCCACTASSASAKTPLPNAALKQRKIKFVVGVSSTGSTAAL